MGGGALDRDARVCEMGGNMRFGWECVAAHSMGAPEYVDVDHRGGEVGDEHVHGCVKWVCE